MRADIENASLLSYSVELIDAYLNEGCKLSREKVHKKAREFYEEYHGIKYVNKNERNISDNL